MESHKPIAMLETPINCSDSLDLHQLIRMTLSINICSEVVSTQDHQEETQCYTCIVSSSKITLSIPITTHYLTPSFYAATPGNSLQNHWQPGRQWSPTGPCHTEFGDPKLFGTVGVYECGPKVRGVARGPTKGSDQGK